LYKGGLWGLYYEEKQKLTVTGQWSDRSRLCITWKQENDVDVLDWSSQCKSQENVWALMKFKLREKIWIVKQLFWDSTYMEVFVSRYAIKLVENMPRRCQVIINKETTGQLINKAPRFISCNMCIFFFNALS